MEKKDVRIQLVISASELAELDNWRADQRIWSRSEAIRRLVNEGMKRLAIEPKAQDERK